VHDTLPAEVDQLTSEWLEHALERRYPGVRVEAVEVVGRQEATNAYARLAVRYADAAGAP
jgi:disulfide oxidoreductase YuzD